MILKPPDSVHSPLERGGNYNDKGIGGAPALCAGTPGDVVTPSFHNISPESHWCCRGQPHGRQLWVSFSASTSHPPCPDTRLGGEDAVFGVFGPIWGHDERDDGIFFGNLNSRERWCRIFVGWGIFVDIGGICWYFYICWYSLIWRPEQRGTMMWEGKIASAMKSCNGKQLYRYEFNNL